MRVRDMAGIRAAKFGQHTKLVHTLARFVEGQAAALARKRVPVLVVVENSGDFNVYGHNNADVKVVHVPKDWQGATREALEDWIDSQIPKEHAAINLSARWLGAGGAKFCRTIEQLLRGEERKQALALMDKIGAALRKDTA